MLSITVGSDLIEIARIRQSLEAFTPHLGRRLFTRGEWDYCQAQADPYASLAVRFAGKEALRKIYGQWGYTDLCWRETEIANRADGAPHVVLHGQAKARAAGVHFAITLAHTKTHAQAFCVAYGERSHDG